MRNMNRTGWGITNHSPLNMVSHAFHMAELWDNAAKQYKIVEKLLDPESDICECITDIENNDILNYLNVMAFRMKYPGITSGNKTMTDFCELFFLWLYRIGDANIPDIPHPSQRACIMNINIRHYSFIAKKVGRQARLKCTKPTSQSWPLSNETW